MEISVCCVLLLVAVWGQPAVSETTAARLELCEAKLVYAAEKMADALLLNDKCLADNDALTKTVALHDGLPPPAVPLVVTATVTSVDGVWIGLAGVSALLAGFAVGLLVGR